MRLEFGLRCCQEATQRMMRDLSFLFSSGRYAMIIIIIKSNQIKSKSIYCVNYSD